MYLIDNIEPWKLLVRDQLHDVANKLPQNDPIRKNEAFYVGKVSVYQMYECSGGNRNFCIASSGNFFDRLIMGEDLSKKVIKEYLEKFGTRNAIDVLDALWKQDPNHEYESFDHFCSRAEHEQYAWIVEYDDKGIVDDKVLRLDLYRMVQKRKEGADGYDFTGGLLHVLKHFCHDGIPLSYEKSGQNVPDIKYVMRMMIEAFFFQELEEEVGGNGKMKYVGQIEYEGKQYKVIFYKNEDAGVYFVDSMHVVKS